MPEDYIRRILAKAEFTGNFQDSYPTAQIHALLDTVPSEDVRPVKHGHWRYQTMTVPGGKGQTYSKWSCSVCKEKAKERTRWCPNCGSRMEGFD